LRFIFSFICCVSSLYFFFYLCDDPRNLHSFPTRRSSDLNILISRASLKASTSSSSIDLSLSLKMAALLIKTSILFVFSFTCAKRSEEHTSELQSRENLVCRLLLEKKKK